MQALRAVLFNAGMMLFAVVFALAGLLFTPFPFRVRYAFISQWARVTLWWLAITCNLRFEVEGRDNIPGSTAIIFCKHQSAWETLALQLIFPPQVWLMKRELLWIPFFGWGLALLEPIAINRAQGSKAIRQLVVQGTARLRAGRWVVIFPEGTRVAPGERGTYHKGGALLAEKSACSVVPVAHNAGEYWPRHGFMKKPGTIRVVIGPAIATTGRKAAEINALAEQWIEAQMQRIGSSQ
ncbi:MAG: 1-acyl-sn-glycerol-3-phosphate acyltransferase [Gammaproteobacteria bacterium]|nr:1-acyl-sn-glycerol-3-phosphate acyltransferase [Gammaproteobacteria bacterium]